MLILMHADLNSASNACVHCDTQWSFVNLFPISIAFAGLAWGFDSLVGYPTVNRYGGARPHPLSSLCPIKFSPRTHMWIYVDNPHAVREIRFQATPADMSLMEWFAFPPVTHSILLELLEKLLADLSPRDRHCNLMFDEMNLASIACYDQRRDQVCYTLGLNDAKITAPSEFVQCNVYRFHVNV